MESCPYDLTAHVVLANLAYKATHADTAGRMTAKIDAKGQTIEYD
jgi:hypothetical protein